MWAAKTLYLACQLLLYRENKSDEIPQLLQPYQHTIDASAILSADLCLRFLPQVIQAGKSIDPEDILVVTIENMLRVWHYSGIGSHASNDQLSFAEINANECLLQLYTDRVIEKKDLQRAQHPAIATQVRASMGNYAQVFWKELHLNSF